ncbi:MAG: acetolactate synthase small subunit [Actinomycetota bacterium]
MASTNGAATAVRHHTLSVLVENKAGVLTRIAGLFARRAFNIFSLAVAPTEDERFSRITIVVDVETAPLEQITKQLDKLINVLEIEELAPADAVERELMLATVEVTDATRSAVIGMCESYGARVLDEGPGAVTLCLDERPDKVDGFEALLAPHGILTVQRTGRIALPRLNANETES